MPYETGRAVVFLIRGPHVRTRVNTRTSPNGAFRYVVRPALRRRPKPRLLAVVDYFLHAVLNKFRTPDIPPKILGI